MRAQIIEAFSESDMSRLLTLPDLQPGSGEAVVALADTNVNPVVDKVSRNDPSITPRLTRARQNHHRHRESAADQLSGRRWGPFIIALPTIGSAARPVAILAVVLSLGACVSNPALSTPASIEQCRTGTLREVQRFGPPGKSAPAWGRYRVRVCEPAEVRLRELDMNRGYAPARTVHRFGARGIPH